MIVVGFAFWGYHWPMARHFGIEAGYFRVSVRELDKALSFGGLFGGALMLYGFTCLGDILDKLSPENRAQLVAYAVKHGLAGMGEL
jgi:hypothetical protein